MSLRAIGGLSFCLLACGCGGKTESEVARPAAVNPPPKQVPAAVPLSGNSATTSIKYVPRDSEKKLSEFLKDLGPEAYAAITDEQVFAIMGEPTRSDPPIKGQRNGQAFTIYEAHWEVPGSGVKSSIGFRNGQLGGGSLVLGLEVKK